MKNVPVGSLGMSPQRTDRLIAEVKAWLQANNVKQKDFAEDLNVTPQHLNNILTGRTQPTGEQALHLQELIKTKPKRKPKAE